MLLKEKLGDVFDLAVMVEPAICRRVESEDGICYNVNWRAAVAQWSPTLPVLYS